MKHIQLLILLLIIVLFSCQKKIEVPADSGSINGDVVANENGVYVEPCHSTTFVTNYPAVSGKVPPFRFTKTHYTSGRVKTINMLSRANPNRSAFKQQAWEVIGTFTYYDNKSVLKGTKQLWEYYKTSTGAAGRRSVVKKSIDLSFYFHTKGNTYGGIPGGFYAVKNNLKGGATALSIGMWATASADFTVGPGSDDGQNYYIIEGEAITGDNTYRTIMSAHGAISRRPSTIQVEKKVKYSYGASSTEKHILYQPSQNWFSLEYTICEVMGWIKLGGVTERTSVSVEFYPYGTSYKVVQSQVYKNHKYDAGGRLLSYMYADGVLQKTTWLCK